MNNGPIKISSLLPGDILLMKDKNRNIFRHSAVVTRLSEDKNFCHVVHFRGTDYPYALTEMSLPPEQVLKARNLEFHVFRLKDSQQALKAASLLKKWAYEWAIPYGKEKIQRFKDYANALLGVEGDLYQVGKPFEVDMLQDKIQQDYDVQRKNFETNILEIAKYAARREISPIQPKDKNAEKQGGFRCIQGLLIGFQVSYLTDLVHPINDAWLSTKHPEQYLSPEVALKENVTNEALVQAIPPAFRLDPKFCLIDTFKYACEQDQAHVFSMGVLEPKSKEELAPYLVDEPQQIKHYYELGQKNREKLRETLFSQQGASENFSSRPNIRSMR